MLKEKRPMGIIIYMLIAVAVGAWTLFAYQDSQMGYKLIGCSCIVIGMFLFTLRNWVRKILIIIGVSSNVLYLMGVLHFAIMLLRQESGLPAAAMGLTALFPLFAYFCGLVVLLNKASNKGLF